MSEPTSSVGTPADPQGSVSNHETEEAAVEEEVLAQEDLAVTAPDVLADFGLQPKKARKPRPAASAPVDGRSSTQSLGDRRDRCRQASAHSTTKPLVPSAHAANSA